MSFIMATSIKHGIQMTINQRRDKTNFTEQTNTEGAVLYTKTTKPHVAHSHLLTLRLG